MKIYTPKDVEYLLVKKSHNVFLKHDELGKMNISVEDVGGQILSVSQFTLFAEYQKGKSTKFCGSRTTKK